MKNFKKIPYYFLLLLLTLGASAIIGFLSFTGMYALVPILGLAAGSFVLSVVYELEIYLQNIKGAFNKLFKRDYLKNELANDYLLRQFENKVIKTETDSCPKFFKDYEAQLKLLHKYSHKRLDEKSQKEKEQVEKTLKDMEKWFALQMYSEGVDAENLTDYETELQDWLKENGQDEEKALLRKRQITYNWVMVFSAISGFFMSVGITYLLVEGFAILPILATLSFAVWPAIIVPMALICGVAYTFLIYNAVTDMIHNDTLRSWYYRIKQRFENGITLSNVILSTSAVALLLLTVALTVCTAGTWWTVAKTARPLFGWMANIPSFVMGIINPIILGVSQLIFNLQNTSESLQMIDDATQSKGSFFKNLGKGIAELFYGVWDNESWLQMMNPFRLILKLTITPLRLILFFGHLISIGVTADRVPGVPEIVSAILGIISEGFEDAHYFVGDLFHTHHHHHSTEDLLKERFGGSHGHDHSADIPTRLLQFLFTPVYAASAAWDYLATRAYQKTPTPIGLYVLDSEADRSFEQLNPMLYGSSGVILQNEELYYANHRTEKVKKIKLTEANREQYESLKEHITGVSRFGYQTMEWISNLTGHPGHGKPLSWDEAWDKQKGLPKEESVTIKPTTAKPSTDWQIEQSVHRIDRFLKVHLQGAQVKKDVAAEKIEGLQTLRNDLQQMHGATEEEIKARITAEAQKEVYGRQRFFNPASTTKSEDFLNQLPERISSVSAAAA